MNLDQAVVAAEAMAMKEIEAFGLPTLVHYNLSNTVGARLAETRGANVDIVKMGTALMDLKLGEAFQSGRLKDHVIMSMEAARAGLSGLLEKADLDAVLHCIEGHHGKIEFLSIEAEICANADCYRFVHPLGSLTYLATLGKRSLPEQALFKQSDAKLEEKWSVVSLSECRDELLPHYTALRQLLDAASSMH